MMVDYATAITLTAPVLDAVVVDTPALGWWTWQGYVGRSVAGFETAVTIVPGFVRLTEPRWEAAPRVDLWHGGEVTSSQYLSLSGDPPFLLSGAGAVTFDPADIPDRFQFLWPRLGIDACFVVAGNTRAELSRLLAALPSTRWDPV